MQEINTNSCNCDLSSDTIIDLRILYYVAINIAYRQSAHRAIQSFESIAGKGSHSLKYRQVGASCEAARAAPQLQSVPEKSISSRVRLLYLPRARATGYWNPVQLPPCQDPPTTPVCQCRCTKRSFYRQLRAVNSDDVRYIEVGATWKLSMFLIARRVSRW